MNITIKRVDPTTKELYDVELLRHKVFHLKTDERLIKTSYRVFHAKHNTLIPFALYVDDDLAAGCYITCLGDSLFVDFLFVKDEYQNSGLRLGRMLLSRILELKPIFEEHFKKQIKESKLTPSNPKAESIYEKLGYVSDEKSSYMRKTI